MSLIKNSIVQARSQYGTRIQATVAVAVVCLLSGCASYSPVTTDNDDGSYRLTVSGLSYTMSMVALTANSREKASAWCATQGKDMQLRQQARSWQPMQVELDFRCIPHQVQAQEQSRPTFK